jgi:two-component system nitrogen regulation response regulator NtrX
LCRTRSLPPRSTMHNILIVDDEPTIRQSLKGVLEDEGFKTSLAESGEAGLESISKNTFDVVLLDVWLPGIDGLETLEKIREKENAPEVIMISGHGTIETAVRATKLGAYDFLEKPLSIDKTLILIKNAMAVFSFSESQARARNWWPTPFTRKACARNKCSSR